jgi:protein-S-isoprenylcysteine O-methyltransferase Ste14
MRIIRIVVGYAISLTVFAFAIPAAIIVFGRGLDRALNLPRWYFGAVNPAVAIVLGGWGIAWMVWSWWHLLTRGRGHPTEAFGVEITPVTRELVTGGPYARTRNPMVFGYFFVMLGIAALHGSAGMLMVIAGLAVIGWVNTAFFEEPHLDRRFGDAYREYRSRVPRFLPLGRRGS